jgi:predicted nucleic acid-binding protein
MYLIDTDVLSRLRRPDRHPPAVRWFRAQASTDLYLSVITIGEIERGIVRQAGRDPEFAGELAAWLDRLLRTYADRILDFDIASARHWGRLTAAIGSHSADLLIAATALRHGLTVITGNVRHFEPTGVTTLDPFQP